MAAGRSFWAQQVCAASRIPAIGADLTREKRCQQVIGVGSRLAGDFHL
jgi:Tfp pilus assembly protein PilZ